MMLKSVINRPIILEIERDCQVSVDKFQKEESGMEILLDKWRCRVLDRVTSNQFTKMWIDYYYFVST